MLSKDVSSKSVESALLISSKQKAGRSPRLTLASPSADPLRYCSLHEDFAVRVEGIDFSLPLHAEQSASLRKVFEKYSVLVLPGHCLDVSQLISFAEQFGPIDRVKVGSVGARSKLSWVGNMMDGGTLASPDSRLGLVAKANQLWHSDGSYKSRPPMASLMHGYDIPPTGGETEFVSMRAVWRHLPESLKARLRGRRALHSYSTSRDRIHPELMTAEERVELPPVWHPLVRGSRTTGEAALFLGSHVSQIEGMSDSEGAELQSEVMAFATESRFVYQHVWRTGDIVMWDNRAVIHRGRPWAMDRCARRLAHVAIVEPIDSHSKLPALT